MKLFKNLGAVTVLAFTLASIPNMAQAMRPTPQSKFMFIDSRALDAQKIAESSWRDCNSLLFLPRYDGKQLPTYRFVGTWGELGNRQIHEPKPAKPDKTSLIETELEIQSSIV